MKRRKYWEKRLFAGFLALCVSVGANGLTTYAFAGQTESVQSEEYDGNIVKKIGWEGQSNTPELSGTEVKTGDFSLTRQFDYQDDYYSEVYYTIQNHTDNDVKGVLILQKLKDDARPSDVKAYKTSVSAKYDASYGGILIYYDEMVPANGTLVLTKDHKVGLNVGASAFGDCEVLRIGGTSFTDGITGSESGGGSTGGGTSSVTDTTTDKELEVEYNYAKLLQESLYFYDANMCGDQVNDEASVAWRGNCHLVDKNASVSIGGKTYTGLDVSGGFHDAGDHVKFGLPQGYAACVLGVAYHEFGDGFEMAGAKEHYRKIADHFCDYFKRCILYDGGEVVGFCYQVGEGNSDHGYWGAPEKQTGARPTYWASADNPATDEVSVAVAALALNSLNFGEERKEDLKAAKDLFAFAQKNTKACASEGAGTFYASDSYRDDYGLAAAALYIATGETKYQTIYQSEGYLNEGWILDWSNSGALGAMLMKESAKLKGVTDTVKNAPLLDGVFGCLNDWGSCRYNAAAQFTGLVYDKLSGTKTYKDWAASQMNYMIGDNPNKRCYAVGYNSNSSKYPHHRGASASTSAGLVNTEGHHTLLGALVGGPKQNGYYHDDQNDFNCNEVALDYNAGYVAALAGLCEATQSEDIVYLAYAKKEVALQKKLAAENEIKILTGYKNGESGNTGGENDTPGGVTDTPGGGTDTPGGGTDTPGGVTDTPGGGTDTPGGGTDTPGGGTDTPGGVTDTPGGGTDTPGGETDTPGGGTDTTGTGQDTPGETTDSNGDKKEDPSKKGSEKKIPKATALDLTARVKKGPAVSFEGVWKLAPKKNLQLSVNFFPQGAKTEKVTYQSSNEKIVRVNEKGLVKAGKKAGTARITVTSESGLQKTVTIKVMKKAVSKIKVTGKTKIKAGKTVKLKTRVSPSKRFASGKVIWISGKPSVASVDEKGRVTALKKGKVKITALAADGSGKKATVTIIVNNT